MFINISASGEYRDVSTNAKNKNDALKFLSEFQNNLRLASESNVIPIDTAQKYLAHLRAVFNKALAQGYILVNPFRKIKNLKIPESLPKFFSDQEFNKILEFVEDQDVKDLILFAMNTGLRQMELITLKWDQIDFSSRTLILDNQVNITK